MEPLVQEMVSEEEMIIDLHLLVKKFLKQGLRDSLRDFDGIQTTFNLTTNNGLQYLPDPEGHMMIFVNGILQPLSRKCIYGIL